MSEHLDDAVRLSVLDRLGDWRLQVGIWGYAVIGEIIEQDALVAERGDPFCSGFWDQTARDLGIAFVDRGRGWERVPDWYALFHLPMAWREAAYAALVDGGET